MVYVAVRLDKEVFEKVSDELLKQGKNEDAENTYIYQEGEIVKGNSELCNFAVGEDGISVSADFNIGDKELGNAYISVKFDEIGWRSLLNIKDYIDSKLSKVVDVIKGFID